MFTNSEIELLHCLQFLIVLFLANNFKRITTFRGFVMDICRKMEQIIYNCRKMGRSIHGDKSILIVEEKTTGAIGQLDRMVLLISTK